MVRPEIKWMNFEECKKPPREVIEKKINDNIQKLIS